MSTEWGAPGGEQKRRWPAKKLALAIIVAVGIAGAGTVAVYAASDSTSTSDSQQDPGGGMPGDGMPDGTGAPGGGAIAQALHGEYVVSDGDGGYTTEVTQKGEVTAISASSITAKSDDGYLKTYTVELNVDVSNIVVGDDVMIVATVSGDTATADSLVEGGVGPAQGS